ncbi:MAG: hypothetical protein PHR28_04950 [candidate division Zixibacteria bacterium]|jgi:hypothetical protein|nr:hypothetical protein [candidate division Zixibacteria bacterium]
METVYQNRKVCIGCKHRDTAPEFEGVDRVTICRKSPIRRDEMSPDEVEMYDGIAYQVYRGPDELNKCPIGRW